MAAIRQRSTSRGRRELRIPKPRKVALHNRVDPAAGAIEARGEPITYEALAAELGCTRKMAAQAVRNAKMHGCWDHEVKLERVYVEPTPVAPSGAPWTEEEFARLDRDYHALGPARLSKLMGRSAGSVRYWARERDLVDSTFKCRREEPDPTPEEIEEAKARVKAESLDEKRKQKGHVHDVGESARMLRERGYSATWRGRD